MMQLCGGCSAQQVSQLTQMLANPGTWLVIGAALTTVLSLGKKKKENK